MQKFPLLSSKYLDYKNWCAVDNLILIKQHYTEQGQQTVAKMKGSMNDSRTLFNWDHLDELLQL